MSGALHDCEAPNAHERPQPVELLQQGLGDAGQILDIVEEGRVVIAGVAEGRDDLLEHVVGQRAQRLSGGLRRPHRECVNALRQSLGESLWQTAEWGTGSWYNSSNVRARV